MPRKRSALRDTAKDIILGLAPSGAGPREPREGIAQPTVGHRETKVKSPAVLSPPPSADPSTIDNLQNLFVRFQRQYKDFVEANEEAHRRLEAKQEELSRRIGSADLNAISRQLEDVKTQMSDSSSKQVSSLAERTDSRLNETNTSIEQLKAVVESVSSRTQHHTETIAQLEARLREGGALVRSVGQQSDQHIERLTQHMSKLSEQSTTAVDQLERRLNEALNAQAKRTESEGELKLKWEQDLIACVKSTDKVKSMHQLDRSKYKERFAKINEALASLERHFEAGTKTMDTIITTDIQSRRVHENGLLARANQMEQRLSAYMQALKRSVDEANQGTRNLSVPALDVDALRREMEGIAADQNKVSMEGLLKLEEKMNDLQKAFVREHEQVLDKLKGNPPQKLREQVGQLDGIKESIEAANQQLRHKVEQCAADDDCKQQLDRCKVAIDKLAESIATVKVFLDGKITQETQQRERAVEALSSSLNQQ